MSDTTTAISPAVYHQILQAIQQGGHEVELVVTTAPDGTQTQTIVIRPTTPLAVAPKEAPKPKPQPKPQPRPAQRPSAPPCTADRCTLTPMKRRPDGYYTWSNIADQMWAEKNKKWWQR